MEQNPQLIILEQAAQIRKASKEEELGSVQSIILLSIYDIVQWLKALETQNIADELAKRGFVECDTIRDMCSLAKNSNLDRLISQIENQTERNTMSDNLSTLRENLTKYTQLTDDLTILER